MKRMLRCMALVLVLALGLSGCGLNKINMTPDTVLGDTLFDEGLLPVKQNGVWGYVNKKGEVKIRPLYVRVRAFAGSGLAAVYDGAAWGYIGTDGKDVIEPQFDEAMDFAAGYAAVRVGSKWGYIDVKGKLRVDPQFDSAGDFSAEGCALVEQNGKYGFISGSGKFVIKAEYDEARSFAYGYAAVRKGARWNFVNTHGETLLRKKDMDRVGNFSLNGLAPVQSGGLWGFVNQQGELVIECQFTQAQGFSVNGMAAVTLGDGWGYINKDGRLVIPPVYDGAMPFAENVAVVQKDGRFGLINSAGEYLAKPVYEDMSVYMNADRIRAVRDGEAGYLNSSGIDVIPFGFAQMCGNYFYDDGFTVVKTGGKYGVINFAGQFVVNPRFDEILFENYEF